MITKFTLKLEQRNDLTYEEVCIAMDSILNGNESDENAAKFLKQLTKKSETDDELLGMLDKMQEFGLHISPQINGTIIDVCGTGGDNMETFNISTAASFVIAAAGGTVAKHGNRSVSGVCGSADIFEHFGFDLMSAPEKITSIIEKHRIGFMFAQKFHPAMKNVAKARKIVGGRTAFNLLGPLSNPADVKNQLIGVFSEEFLDRLPLLLKRKGSQNIITVRSEDGMDEFSTSSKNHICVLKDGKIKSQTIDGQEFGLQKSQLSDIKITSKEEAISSFVSVLNNTANRSKIEVTALNAAAGLIVANKVDNFSDGVEIALNTIKSGQTFDLFERFIKDCGDIQKLEEVCKQ